MFSVSLSALMLALAAALASGQEWEAVTPVATPVARHESSFVMGSPGKAYLIGGRDEGAKRPINVYDVTANTWTVATAEAPVELHHFQAVAVDSKIFIPAAWTGGYPNEQNVQQFLVYDTVADSYSTLTPMPEGRRRGSTAVVHYEGKIYVSHGNIGGHGEQATTLAWLDIYDIATDSWTTGPDAPNARDHTGGAVLSGGKFCVAGGRDGGIAAFFQTPILPVDCYDFASGSWTAGPDIPTGRAAVGVGSTCDGEMIVAGGEGLGQAYSETDIFDGTSWRTGPALIEARHGTGLAIGDCSCGFIYISSGGGTQGGADEIASTERYTPAGQSSCVPGVTPATTAAPVTTVVLGSTAMPAVEVTEPTVVATEPTVATATVPATIDTTEPVAPAPVATKSVATEPVSPAPEPVEKSGPGNLAILAAGPYKTGKVVASGSKICPLDFKTGFSFECVMPGVEGPIDIAVNGKTVATEYFVPYTIGGDYQGVVIAWTPKLPTGKMTISCKPKSSSYASFATKVTLAC